MAKETSTGRETARVQKSGKSEMDEFNKLAPEDAAEQAELARLAAENADAAFMVDERPPLATRMHHVAQQPEDSCPNCGAEWHAPQIMTVSMPDGAERHCTDCNLAWRITAGS